jgi:hypothetical protein
LVTIVYYVVIYPLFASIGDVVQQCHALGAGRLCISDTGQAGQFKSHGVASLTSVHIIPKGQNDLQHLAQPLGPLDLLGGLQDCQDLGLELRVPNVKLFLVVQRPQPNNNNNNRGLFFEYYYTTQQHMYKGFFFHFFHFFLFFSNFVFSNFFNNFFTNFFFIFYRFFLILKTKKIIFFLIFDF